VSFGDEIMKPDDELRYFPLLLPDLTHELAREIVIIRFKKDVRFRAGEELVRGLDGKWRRVYIDWSKQKGRRQRRKK
jgi:hypothetical protein